MDRLYRFSLPLLAKELVELSGRPRTYLVRVVYAGLLLFISWLVLYSNIPAGASSPLDVLGRGRIVVQVVAHLQNISLQLLLPAVACGVFTIEKERNTLSLLFLTRLGPWTILFEKLLSRLVLTIAFLMVSYPVLAFSYSLGGITMDRLFAYFLTLLVNSVSIISISVLCSSYFRTTTGALMGSYLLLFLSRIGVAAILLGSFTGFRSMSEEVFFTLVFMGGINSEGLAWGVNSHLLIAALGSIPWLIISVVCILLARWFLVSRAFLQPQNVLKEFFKRLDRIFDKANNSLARGIVVVNPTARLPEFNPVAWRETTTRSLGQARYLIRILVTLEMPVLAILLCCIFYQDEDTVVAFAVLIEVVLWVAMALATCALSAGLISGERSRQTLDVLLTTPLFGRDIIREKLAGIERLIWIFEAPLWTCVIVRCLTDQGMVFAVCQASMLLIYPRVIAWYSMWIGLTSKTTTMAVVKSLLALLAQCLAPFIVLYTLVMVVMFSSGFQGPGKGFEELMFALAYFSPMTMFVVSELAPWESNFSGGPALMHPLVGLVVNSMIHVAWLAWARFKCLNDADKLLGRARGKDPEEFPVSAPPTLSLTLSE